MIRIRKISKPTRKDGAWRILRHDGKIVGAYTTKELAKSAIAKMPWLK